MRGAIIAEGVGKRYRRYAQPRSHTLQETIMNGFRKNPPTWFWGLRDVTFTVQPGRTVGVIGRNGAGKSSLLRLIGGVGRPDEGRIAVHGRVGALLDLGAGMTDDLTGRENAILAGMIAGMRRSEVLNKLDSIIAFAELEKFIDEPLRTYSSGMRLRLAFAVAIHIEPEILLVDEVLAVGDSAFQRKCLERIEQIKKSGCTIFFVSHDESMISAICDDLLFLREGRVVAFGPTKPVMRRYHGTLSSGQVPEPEAVDDEALADGRVLRFDETRFGTQECQIANVSLTDPTGRPVTTLLPGGALVVRFECRKRKQVGQAIASVTILNEEGTAVFDTNTSLFGMDVFREPGATAEPLSVQIDRLDLVPGRYSVEVGLYSPDWERTFDNHHQVYEFEVLGLGHASGRGIVEPPYSWGRGTEDQSARPARVRGTGA